MRIVRTRKPSEGGLAHIHSPGATRRGRLVGTLTAAVLVALGASACGSAGPSAGHEASSATRASSPLATAARAAHATSKQLVVDTSFPPATLDPAVAVNPGDFIIPSLTYVTLVRFATKPGPDGTTQIDYTKVVPELAKSWTLTDHDHVYTFHLNTHFRFNDGTPINAAAVKYSYERDIKINAGGAYVAVNGNYTPPEFKSITTPNSHTVVFHLNYSDSNVLVNWAQPVNAIVEPSVVNAHGGVKANKVNPWVAGHIAGGGGPFVMTSYNAGTSATFVRNPKYPLPVGTRKLILNIVTSPSTLSLDAENGTADITVGEQPSLAASLKHNNKVRVLSYPTPFAEYLGFNFSKAPGNNLDLRKALGYATPLRQILSKAAFGFGSLFYGPLSPELNNYNAALSKIRPFNLALARKLIKQSGLHAPVNLTITLQAGDEEAAAIGPILKQFWGQVGVNVTLQTLSSAAYVTATEKGQDQAYIRQAGPEVPNAGYYLGYSMKCGSVFNLTKMCVPKLDKLLAEGRTAPLSAQQPIWNKVIKIWRNYAPRVQFYMLRYPIVLSKNVKHYAFDVESILGSLWS